MTPWALLLLLTIALRVPSWFHPIQGDDSFYLAAAMHAQIDPLHPHHFHHVSGGADVDMRGFPHPPGNAWINAALLALFGDVSEVGFHAAYTLFSLLAVAAAWSLARQFSSQPLVATLLFMATPAFVINGTSLESDLPFLALWLVALASHSFIPAVLAALISYQGIILTPLLWLRDRRRWVTALAPVLAIAALQLWERSSRGAMPASIMSGYFTQFGLQSLGNKLNNAIGLTVHLGWLVLPLLTLAGRTKREWIATAVVAAVAGLRDPSPLFWLPLACGVLAVAGIVSTRHEFPAAWAGIFFASALAIFFAGSARYLLPLALPVAILTANRLHERPRLLVAGFALQLALSSALAFANYQHWQAYREIAASIPTRDHRVWINAEWGLRFYLESAGGLPLVRGQAMRPGDWVVTSRLSFPVEYTTGGGVAVPVAEHKVVPSLPVRLLALDSPSGYSAAHKGQRAFDVTNAPADIVTVVRIVERKPELSFLPMNAPEAGSQIASGVYQLEGSWRWTGPRAVVLLKSPPHPGVLEATFRIVDTSRARRVTLWLDGAQVAEGSYPGPGLYTLRTPQPVTTTSGTATVILAPDSTFQVPGDQRELGVILVALGWKN